MGRLLARSIPLALLLAGFCWLPAASPAARSGPHGFEETGRPSAKPAQHHPRKLRVTTSRLRWHRVRRATYYEVVLWRDRSRFADVWTTRHMITLRRLRRTLAPQQVPAGRYLWFAYPGFGRRSHHRYGHLAGRGILAARK